MGLGILLAGPLLGNTDPELTPTARPASAAPVADRTVLGVALMTTLVLAVLLARRRAAAG